MFFFNSSSYKNRWFLNYCLLADIGGNVGILAPCETEGLATGGTIRVGTTVGLL